MNKMQAKKVKPFDVLIYNCSERVTIGRTQNLINRIFVATHVEDRTERDHEDNSIHSYTNIYTIDTATGADVSWGTHMYMRTDDFKLLYESMAYLLKNNYDIIIRKKNFEIDDPHRDLIKIIDNINTNIKAACDLIASPVSSKIIEKTVQEVYDMNEDVEVHDDIVSRIWATITEISELTPLTVKEEENKDVSAEMKKEEELE